MAHEIEESDTVLLYGKPAWHGLGVVIEKKTTFQDAADLGLLPRFDVELRAAYFWDAATGEYLRVPDRYVVVRLDKFNGGLVGASGIGTVGCQFAPIQNSELWRFSDKLLTSLGGHLETGGSLRGGRLVWGLIKCGVKEYLTGDPVEEFCLVVNGHDGSAAFRVVMGNIRVVCANTMQASFAGASNQVWIRHTDGQVADAADAVELALGFKDAWDRRMAEAMGVLAGTSITAETARAAIVEILTPSRRKRGNVVSIVGGEFAGMFEIGDGAEAQGVRADRVMEILESGIGLEKVRGTAYGLFHAFVEWVDHDRLTRRTAGHSRPENRFQSVMLPDGSGYALKQKAMDVILKMAE